MNEAGECLKDFCIKHELLVANTLFKQHPRWLYVWTSPDNQLRNQTDYIAVGRHWRSHITNCRTYPGADCDSDHNLLVVSVRDLTAEGIICCKKAKS